MNLKGTIGDAIEEAHVDINEFGDIVIYLLDHGVMCRSKKDAAIEKDPAIERDLYDRFVRIKDEVADYLSIIGVKLHHNEEFQSVRVYAPDAIYPKSNEIAGDNASSLMRMPIGKELSAALMICYLLYEQYRSEGRLEDDFTAVVPENEFLTAHMTMLGIEVDASRNKTARSDTYRTMKRIRAINYHKDFFLSDEYPLIIRPLIYDIVLEEAIAATLDTDKGTTNED